ncbi:MAG: hypothetical protein AB9835_04700 [Eubacteriales bacterium]
MDSKPRTFSDLLQISGLSHGTDVWMGNAQELIKKGICTISEVIGTRDNIMVYLLYKNLEPLTAFKIMEDVRKGKGLTADYERAMKEKNVPDWYIESCKKIKYMFPKAHAAAYVMSALRLGWFKVHRPVEFYAAYFTVQPDGFDGQTVMAGHSKVRRTIKDIQASIKEKNAGDKTTAKDEDTLNALMLVDEMLSRGYKFLPVDLYKSAASAFLPENGMVRLPFSSLSGVGDSAALNIVKARPRSGEFFSIEELRISAGLNKSVLETLRQNGILDGLTETDQLSLF